MGLIEVVQMLVGSRGFDVNLRVRNSSFIHCSPDCPNQLPKGWQQVNGFILACESGNLDLVQFLVNTGIDVNHHSTSLERISPLVAASAFGRVDIVRFLEQDGRFDTDSIIDLNAALNSCHKKEAPLIPQRQHAFQVAIKNGHTDVVEYFIGDGRVDLNRTVSGSLMCGRMLISAEGVNRGLIPTIPHS